MLLLLSSNAFGDSLRTLIVAFAADPNGFDRWRRIQLFMFHWHELAGVGNRTVKE